MSFLVKIRFGKPRDSAEGDAEDVIDNYLAALMRNGQIYETQVIKNIGLPLDAYVSIPQPGAMGPRYSSPWVKKALGKVKEVFGWEGLNQWNQRQFMGLDNFSSNPIECVRCFVSQNLYLILMDDFSAD